MIAFIRLKTEEEKEAPLVLGSTAPCTYNRKKTDRGEKEGNNEKSLRTNCSNRSDVVVYLRINI